MLLLPKLVTTAWLAAHLADPHLVILHVGRPDTYGKHIPGAVQTDLTQLSVNPWPSTDTASLMVEMLPPAVLRARLESYGIDDHSTIIVYAADDRSVTSATRTVFTLRVAGLGAHAALLDGGLGAWSAEKRPLTDAVPHPASGHITATPQASLVVDAAWVASHLNKPGILVVDARNREFYDGRQQSEARRGHIPSAQSLPFEVMFDTTGKLKSPAEITELFRAVGATPGDTILAYCHIGMRATAVIFAADQVGYPVRLYDGSFQDWSKHTEYPVVDPSSR